MSEYLSDAEEKEQLIEWWKDNGRFIVTGVGLGLIGIFVWRGWTNHLDTKAGNAAVVYEEMVQAVNSNETEKAAELLNEISTDFKGTSYVSQAHLLNAKIAVEANKLPEAVAALESAISTSKDAELVQLANFRLAKLKFALKDYPAALSAIKAVKSDAYAPLISELKGDIYYAQNDLGKAREAYERAQTEMQESRVGDPNLLQMKLSDLGTAQTTSAE